MSHIKRALIVLSILVAFTLVFAACDGNEDTVTTEQHTTANETETTAEANQTQVQETDGDTTEETTQEETTEETTDEEATTEELTTEETTAEETTAEETTTEEESTTEEDTTPTTSSKGLAFELNSDGQGYTLTGIGTCTDKNIVIDTYNDLPVTAIGDSALAWQNITAVRIGNSVTDIGAYAFENCTELLSVTLGEGVSDISDGAFRRCLRLAEIINKSAYIEDITVGESSHGNIAYYAIEVHDGESKMENKDGYIFYPYGDTNYLITYTDASTATALTLPDSYNGESYILNHHAFFDSYYLESVTIPSGITEISNAAFSGCSKLSSVNIPDSVESIGSSAFYNCDSLKSVVIGNGVERIGERAFNDCSRLKNVTLGSSLLTIGENAFLNCIKLYRIDIPDSVTRIDANAFDGSGLVSIRLGANLNTVGKYAFSCSKLVEVIDNSQIGIASGEYMGGGDVSFHPKKVHTGESEIVEQNGFLFYTFEGINYLLGYVGEEIENLILPTGYNGESYEIYDSAFYMAFNSFYGVENTDLVIPDCVTAIGTYAFRSCDLVSVTIPDSVKRIDPNAFEGLQYSMISVTFEDAEGWSLYSGDTFVREITAAEISQPNEAMRCLTVRYNDNTWIKE